MTAITAAAIKELREKTQAGMMDCKKALTEAAGDMDAAVDWLRKKGLSAAAKKSGRVAAEGLVAVATNSDSTKAAVVELNSETDFVAKNEKFQKLAAQIAQVALDNTTEIEALKATSFPGSDRDVNGEVAELVGVIGENMQLRRSAEISGDVVVSYIHNAVAENIGKIAVLVSLKTQGDKEKAKELGKQVAMHIAAIKPEALNVSDLNPELVERERAVLTDQARASGKPEEVIEKMIDGRIRKFYSEVVLLEQPFVMDGKTPVKQAVADAAKEIGADVEIAGYTRFTLGEGVEKKEEDFAAEVAKAANS